MVGPFAVAVSLSNAVVVVVSAVSMCSQKLNDVALQPAGMTTVWDSVSVWVVPYPSSQAYQLPECEVSPAPFGLTTPAVLVHGAAVPGSKPGLPNSWLWELQPPWLPITQLNEAEPCAPVVSVAVTVTLEVPAVVGVPEIRPAELIDRPAGSPLAVKVSVWPDAESVAPSCRLTAVPTVPVWLPGLVTVTVLPVLVLLARPAMPSGVPMPVGPSYPVSAVQR